MCDDFSALDSVTKTLQRNSITLSEVRILFDAVISKFPETSRRLSSNAPIVTNPTLESALVRVQEGQISALSQVERDVLKPFLQDESSVPDNLPVTGKFLSFAEQALKKRKVRVSECTYVDTRFVLPTTNIVERFFSKAGHCFSKRRKQITPENLEMQLFLHMNSHLWGIEDVREVMN